MTYSIRGIIEGIAARIASFCNYPIYISPTQQSCTPPCFFICLMPGNLKDEIDNRYYTTLNFDVVFLQNPNIVNASDGIISVLENLDLTLDTISYTENSSTITMYTYDRKHHLENMDLHYQLTFHARLMKSEVHTYMKTLTEAVYVKKQS